MVVENNPLLPIKRVIAESDDFYENEPGGGTFAPLVEVDAEFIASRLEEISEIEEAHDRASNKWKNTPSVGVVQLLKKAIAKSKRPVLIFNENTCPIIGGSGLGTLYISVTSRGLENLKRIASQPSGNQIAHISTIKSIRPFRQEDAMGGATISRIMRLSAHRPLRVILFHHGEKSLDRNLKQEIVKVQNQTGSRFTPLHYSDDVDVYEFATSSPNDVATIASFPGTRSIGPFPQYHVVRTASRVVGTLPANRIPQPVADMEYPNVGMVDTGTDPNNRFLSHWVSNRWDVVPTNEQSNNHGSFVGGLLCAGKPLNHNDARFPSVAAKITDVVAFDRTESVSEQILLRIIRLAVLRFPYIKIWNLSFSVDGSICRDDEFSPFGLALAQIADEQQVVFVIAAGNTPELRGWPRYPLSDDRDRLCAPADSPTAIVVGAMAHRDSESTCVRQNAPSPFGRRGPPAGYLLAPHVMHAGGNCDARGDATQVALLSSDGHGNLAEDIGTSFSTPLVSALLAGVYQSIATENRPDILTKALLLHSTLLKNVPIDASHWIHSGLGLPPDLSEITHCRQSSATVVFAVNMTMHEKKPKFAKEHFPIPRCLVHDGSLKAEIAMTLAYSPPIDPHAGCECCRTNVNARLGTLHPRKGSFGYEIYRYPKVPEGQYEIDLVTHGYRWSPFKMYYREFSRKNTLGNRQWELRLDIERRKQLAKAPIGHIAYVIVTVRGLGKDSQELPIYDEMIVEMDRLGWRPENLLVRERIQTSN